MCWYSTRIVFIYDKYSIHKGCHTPLLYRGETVFSTQRQEVYIENECQNIRRGIRDIRDITGMPASDRQNTREIQGE